MPEAAAAPFPASPVSQKAHLEHDHQEDPWGQRGDPLIAAAPQTGGDVLDTPDPRRWLALALSGHQRKARRSTEPAAATTPGG
jgi:hypothetical protein